MELVKASADFQGHSYGSVSSDDVEDGLRRTPSTNSSLSIPEGESYETESGDISIQDIHRSVSIPGYDQPWLKKLFAFAGPGALVAVGYMDPGNWTSDIGGGSAYNYDLLFVVLWSSLIAFFFQVLSVKLAVASEKDLAQACKIFYSDHVNICLWVAAEVAIIATDLAEVLGSAIALQLLFGWRLEIGVLVTAGDVVILFMTQGSRIRAIEFVVLLLILVIVASFAMQMILCKPNFEMVMIGMLVPKANTLTDPSKLFMAVSILGATIMPHSLFLHSNMVLTRSHELSTRGKQEAIDFAVVDTTFSLSCAFFVNASIVIVAAATFYKHGYHTVANLYEANQLLNPLLGNRFASVAFGVALLAAGLNSTLTGTMAGQIVMEGFIHFKLHPMYRRILTRALAIVPAIIVILIGGPSASNDLLLMSQVILSFALPFAVFPLVQLTSDVNVMGEEFVNSKAVTAGAYLFAILISALNVALLVLSCG